MEKATRYQAEGRWFPLVTDDLIPTFCVPKKDPSKARLVFDERQRNANRIKDKTPLPNMAAIIERVHAADHQSQFDLIVAYEQFRLARALEALSGFITPMGAYGSRVGSMEDANMPGSFQRFANILGAEHLGVDIHVYLDNWIVATKGDLQHHLITVLWLLERLVQAELYIGDYEIDAPQTEVLGSVLGKEGKLPGPRVLDPILAAPQPTTIAEVDRMLGAFNFCGQHGTAAQAVARTYLSDATRFLKPRKGQKTNNKPFPAYTVNGKFVWTPTHESAWDEFKDEMKAAYRLRPFNAPPEENLRTYLITDASLTGIAGYVAQGPLDGTLRDAWPIDVWARPLTPTESNYSTTMQEKPAVVQALAHFEHYLRKLPFTLCTDHQALLGQGSVNGKPSTDRKLARWQWYMDTFQMDYAHIPGSENKLADMLSRMWEQYTRNHPTDASASPPNDDSNLWRWNMIRNTNSNPYHPSANAINNNSAPAGEDESAEEGAQAGSDGETGEEAVHAEEWHRGEVWVAVQTLEMLFGKGSVSALIDSQKADKLFSGVYEKPEDYENFGATVEKDGVLRMLGRIVIPVDFKWMEKPFRETLVEFAHVERTHPGVAQTLAGLRGYYWAGQLRDLQRFGRMCDQCQRSKSRHSKALGRYQAMPIRVAGFKDVEWDFQGPFPAHTDAQGAVATGLWNILARGTGYVILVPIRHDITAEELALVFMQRVYPTTGIPESVLSDRDSKFTSQVWAAVMKQLPTRVLMTTSFHARGNGGIEGKHRILNMAMRTIVDSRQSNWIDCEPHVQFRLNATESSATGYTPFELTMGYIPTLFPMAADLSLDTLDAVKVFMSSMDAARLDAKDALTAARLKQQQSQGAGRGQTPQYRKNEWAPLSTDNLRIKGRDTEGAKKWAHKWTGPFRVVQQRGTTVELDLPPGWKGLHPRFHVELIKPYEGRAERYDEPAPELDLEGKQVLEVEEIVNHRWNAKLRRFEWRVRWKGYSPSENTWEPLEHLAGASELLKQYRARHGRETLPAPKDTRASSLRRRGTRMTARKVTFREE